MSMTWLRPAALRLLSAATLLAAAAAAPAQTAPRTAFVHLFEWKWTDVARECEAFLGPKGFAAVQVSPPNEHNQVNTGDGAPYPWWMRYQPVSYNLDRSRSGTRAEFQDMVSRCKAVGVGIYVDAVINHMSGGTSGTSSAGRAWSYHNYPGLYSSNDFHSPVCGITNYSNAGNVQNCELSGLQDLNTGASYVRGKIADYLVGLADMGVAGFRVDAAKHISPTDLGAIIDNVNSRVSTRPYWFLEVIGAAGEAVQPSQYLGLSASEVDITEFAYGPQLYGKFAGGGKLADLRTFGETWGLLSGPRAVAFTDNHDKQRGHGGGGQYLTYHYGATYDLANVFMLAWPYGYPALMSSYAFSKDSNYDTSFGPPYNSNGSTRGPWDGATSAPACFSQVRGGWVCEHRYRPIANMVAWRNAADGLAVSNWWDNGNNQIAFGRGNAAFVAINKESGTLSRSFQTGLPTGRYCDVIGGELSGTACTGDTYTVDASGFVTLNVEPFKAVALHKNAKPAGTTTLINTTLRVQGAAPATGQTVYVVGNVTQLGGWDACKAVPLTLDGNSHVGLVSLPASTAVQYKFIKHSSCNSTSWESGNNRTLSTPASGSTSACGVWSSTAACSSSTTPPTGSASVTFNVSASTVMGQSVYLVGNTPALGAWNPASAVTMAVVPGSGSGSTNTWRATVSLPASSAAEYKFIKKDGSGTVVWESGANRTLATGVGGSAQTVNTAWK
jgi:alpha-amylase